jgi:hypothetical protein
MLLLIAFATMLVGLIVARKWEGIGGFLILCGLVFVAIVNHGVNFNAIFVPMLAAGLRNK